jgi:HD-like signal output (HDOD) protein
VKKRILIVDDEVKVLQALHRMLLSKHSDWHLEFTDGGAKALGILSRMTFDVVVADLFMPGMNGDQLLREVMLRYPRSTRIILYWQADQPALSKAYSVAHQFLLKPCDTSVLIETLTRAVSQPDRIGNNKVKMLVSQLRSVPNLPSLYLELMREMQTNAPSPQRAVEIIARDPSMTSKIVQLVNSPQFGLARTVSTPTEAAIYLGLEKLSALLLAFQIYPLFSHADSAAVGLNQVWAHSWETAILSKRICSLEHRNLGLADHAFIAGLLHDLGKLVLATSLPDPYHEAIRIADERRQPLWKAEEMVFTCSHAEVASHLLGLWGVSEPIVEGVAYHHRPSDSPNPKLSTVMAVHIANALIHERQTDVPSLTSSTLDLEYVRTLGPDERIATWRDECALVFKS